MAYVNGVLMAVPEANKSAFLAHCEALDTIMTKHGATRIVENWEVDVPDGEVTSFAMALKCEPGEKIVFSWIEWPDKATCDGALEKMMPEMEAAEKDHPMPFDGKRMIFGGFETVFEL